MSQRIEDLEPVTHKLCEAFLTDCIAAGLKVRITHTLRTFDEQEHLYAKGRTIAGEECDHGDDTGPRKIGTCERHPLGTTVTKARGGQSPHNFGAAFDMCFSGSSPYAGPWTMVGAIGQSLGLVWGSSWGDRPHFERADWRTLRKHAVT